MKPAETPRVTPAAEAGPRPRGRRGPRGPRGLRGPRPAAALAMVAAAAVIAASGAAPAAAATVPAPPIPVPAPPTPVTTTAELTGRDLDAWLDGLVPAALDSTGVPGAVVTVVHEGEVLTSRGYGYADTGADGGDPVPVDAQETLFRPGSVAKPFTATAVMRLVEDGELDLDTDVHEYLDFTVPTSFDEPLTLRHLLTHTPGFEERVDGTMLPEGVEVDLRDHLVTDPPEQVYAPGTVPAYSNYGYALAGYIVERTSGVPFEEYVRTEVLEPLEMDSSTFVQPPPADLAERVAGGYPDDRRPAEPFEVVGGSPAGALTSSAPDMAAFMLAHLGDSDQALLAPETLELMHTPALTEDSLGTLAGGPRMTLGFFEEDRNGHRILGHGGDTNLFHAHLQIYPDDATGIFVALNGGGYEALDSVQLREAVLFGFADRYFPSGDGAGETGATGETATVEPTAVEHAAMAAGTYESSRSMHSTFLNVLGALGGQFRVVAQEDGTILVTPGPETGTPTVYEEVEPWVWREVGGRRLLSMRVVDDQVEAIGYAGAFTLLRVDGGRDAALTLPLLIGSLAILLLAVLSWPVRALLRLRFGLPRRERAGRTARVLTRVGVVAALAAPVGWTLASTEILALRFVGTGTLSAVLAAQWLGVAAIVPAAVVLFDDVRRRAGWRRCLGSALVLIGLVGVAAFAVVYHLLTFDLSY